ESFGSSTLSFDWTCTLNLAGLCLSRVGEVEDVLGDPEYLAENAAHDVLGNEAVGAGIGGRRDPDADPAAHFPGLHPVTVGAQRRLQRLQACRVDHGCLSRLPASWPASAPAPAGTSTGV